MPESDIENVLSQSAGQLWERELDRRYGFLREEEAVDRQQQRPNQAGQRRDRLTDAIVQLLEDYSMVSFIPLNIRDEDSIDHVLTTVDHAIQYGEDLEVRGADMDDFQEPPEEE